MDKGSSRKQCTSIKLLGSVETSDDKSKKNYDWILYCFVLFRSMAACNVVRQLLRLTLHICFFCLIICFPFHLTRPGFGFEARTIRRCPWFLLVICTRCTIFSLNFKFLGTTLRILWCQMFKVLGSQLCCIWSMLHFSFLPSQRLFWFDTFSFYVRLFFLFHSILGSCRLGSCNGSVAIIVSQIWGLVILSFMQELRIGCNAGSREGRACSGDMEST